MSKTRLKMACRNLKSVLPATFVSRVSYSIRLSILCCMNLGVLLKIINLQSNHRTGIYSDKREKCMPDQPYSVLSTCSSMNLH